MDAREEIAINAVTCHHEPPPATLEELLKVSSKRGFIFEKKETAEAINVQLQCTDEDSDSDYQCHDGASDEDNDDDSALESDEWQLHLAEPQEGLYLQEMRRQRANIDEKEAHWVRGYIQAQRAWKVRTGRSIDEFHIPDTKPRRLKKSCSVSKKTSYSVAREPEEQEAIASMLVTHLEALLLLAAIVFVCLSLGIQLYAPILVGQEA